jgi:hypothetical protein
MYLYQLVPTCTAACYETVGMTRARRKLLLSRFEALDLNRCALTPSGFRHAGCGALSFNV